MSKLTGALGALQGLEKGMVGRDQAKAQLAQTLFDLRKYQETTLPESQQQVAESKERSRMYAAQTGIAQEELQAAPTKRLMAQTNLQIALIGYNKVLKQINAVEKYEREHPGEDIEGSAYLNELLSKKGDYERTIWENQNKIAEEKGYGTGGGPAAKGRGRAAAAKTEAVAEEEFAEGGGAELIAQGRRVGLEKEITLAPITINQALEELRQSEVTTREMEAGEPYKIASYPLTQRLLQTQVTQAEQNLSVSQTYDMNQAQANLASTQENTARTKREIWRIDAEMKDKAALDGIATNSGLTNPITNKPVTTWDEYKLIMNFKLDEQLAMVRAISTGDEYPQMTQVIKQITTAQDATFMSKAIPHKSGNMVNNFISYIPFFLSAGQDPYAAWELSKMSYVDLVEMSGRDLAGYLPADMVVRDEQTQRVMTAIQQALSQQARTSAAGGTSPAPGTTPKVYGPPTPSGVREQVAGGSVIDTTFGLDAATRQKIAGIIDVYGDQPDIQARLITEIGKETDMGKRDQMASFAEWYYGQKK